MELIHWFVDFFLHLDRHLAEVIQSYGTWTYALLFVIVFLETGLVVTPFLPGDSLLFAAGSFAALRQPDGSAVLGFPLLFLLLSAAAILGDTVNYAIGAYLGPKVFHFPTLALLQPGAPAQDPRLLREVRRQDDHHRPLRADRPHLRAVRGRASAR